MLLVLFPTPLPQLKYLTIYSFNCIFMRSGSYFYLTAFFISLSSILVCSHGHLENKNQPALSSAESLPQAKDKASSPASCFGKEWWSGMWGLLWVLGFPVTGKSFKMLTRETCGSKEPLQTLLSLNKVQKSFRRADRV